MDKEIPQILVIEDDRYFAEILKKGLEKKGYKVHTAEDGESGLRDAMRKQPDVITLDVVLPKMNGFSVLRGLKGDKDTKKIPVIMCTSLGQQEDVERGFELGAEDYLIKQHFTVDEVVDRVGLALKTQ